MAVVFSKLSGANDGFYKAVEGIITTHVLDVDTGKTNDDMVLEGIFNVKTSNKFGERQGGMTEFANFTPITEGAVAPLDGVEEGYAKLIQHTSFSKSFATTRDMVDDGDLDEAKTVAANYVKSYKRSKLEFATAFLASIATTFSYGGKTFDSTTGDAAAVFSTAHLGTANQSNIFTNVLGSDAVMLNRLANYGRNIKNESGHILGYTFDTIVIPGNCYAMEEFVGRLIGTEGVVGSANNDVNTQKGKWRLIVNHRWEAASGTEPYILVSSESVKSLNSLPFYNRLPLDMMNEVDIQTRNLVWNGYTRFSCGCFNWRSLIMGGAASGTTLA